jgi:hypothetical protein
MIFPGREYGLCVLVEMMRDHLLLVAIHDDGQRAGLIGGAVSRHFFNPAVTFLTETFWWVAEAYRQSRAGLMLLRAFVEWGESHVHRTVCAIEAESPVRESVLTQRGFKLIERNYVKVNENVPVEVERVA